MNIKSFYKKTAYLPLLLFLAAMACTDDIVSPDDTDGEGAVETVPLVLNLKGLFGEENAPPTYTFTPQPDQPGTGAENTITDITVFVFSALTGACDKILVGASSPVGPEQVKSGAKNIVVVANSTGKFPAFYAPGQEALVTYTGLRRLLTTAMTTLPTAPFLMTGEVNAVLQINKPATAPNQVTINVERAVAKVKIFVTKDQKASPHNLTLQKITLNRAPRQVSVIENAPAATILYDVSDSRTTFDPLSGIIPDISTNTYCQLADTFYLYESLALRDTSRAVYLELEVAVNSPTNIRKARVFLAQDDSHPGDTIYNVRRNYWYNVYLNIVNPGMDSVVLRVVASPWNVADTIHAVIGEGFEAKTAVPFKLVKYYDTQDLNANPRILAIDSHSKGASWIDLKVTKGTQWELRFPFLPQNLGAIISVDSGKTWLSTLSGTGTDSTQRLYIYRPFDDENNEPKNGPLFTLGIYRQDLGYYVDVASYVVEGRDSLIFPTNCYMLRPMPFGGWPYSNSEIFIPLKHVYDYWEDFILPNGDTIPVGALSAVASWRDTASAVMSSPLTIVNPGNRRNSYIRGQTTAVPGSTVLNFMVGTNVYWSFHIWNTEYSPYEPAGQILFSNGYSKNIFMDRNLGAHDTLDTPNGSSKGLYYQFGRKDPFPRTDDWTWTGPIRGYDASGTKITALMTLAQPSAATVVRPRQAIPTVLSNPTAFFTTPFYNHNVEDSCLWNTKGGNKTAFDPCPEGYRVPKQEGSGVTYSPWYGSGLSYGGSYSSKFNNGYYSPSVKYYPGSFIQPNGTHNFDFQGYYWTANCINRNSSVAKGMYNGILDSSIDKAIGANVRCVVDKNYIVYKKGTVFGRYTADVLNNL